MKLAALGFLDQPPSSQPFTLGAVAPYLCVAAPGRLARAHDVAVEPLSQCRHRLDLGAIQTAIMFKDRGSLLGSLSRALGIDIPGTHMARFSPP
jgi:hypothetical protein